MDTQELVSKYLPLIKRNWLALSLGILGMIFFAYGLIGLLSANKTGSEDIVFEANSAVKQDPAEAKTILVDVEGAVMNPGVYRLPQESRIRDGLVAAGGISAQADREYVAKNFNLATKLTDGAKIYVPAIGEAVNGVSVLSGSSGTAINTLININTSSQSQLEELPGIGPVTAQKIIAGRPYGSVNELLDGKIVSAKVFNQIKEKVSVY